MKNFKIKNPISIFRIREYLGFKFLFFSEKLSFIRGYYYSLVDFIQGNKNIFFVHHVLNKLYNERIISVNGVFEARYELGNSVFYDVYIRNYDGMLFSRGTSKNKEEAYAKALGEIFERQSTQLPLNEKEIIYMNIKEMRESGKVFVDPNIYNKPSSAQIQLFKNYHFDDHTIFGWVEVKNFYTNKNIFILAQDAYWSYFRLNGEPRVTNMSTNGCAGGYSVEEATKSAFYEIVQRDTFFKYWYFNKSPKKILSETLPKDSEAMSVVRDLQKKYFIIEILDMTDEAGIPTIVCVLYKDTTGWFIGASTADKKIHAIERAIQEAFSVYMWFYQTIYREGYNVDTFKSTEPLFDFLDTRITDSERCILWGSKWFKDRQDHFLIEGEGVVFEESSTNKKFALKEFIKNKYGDTYINVIKNELLDEYNYFAVKAIAPSAYSLFLIEHETLPVKNGIYPQNSSIHPFP